MADATTPTPQDADGYYGDDEMNSEELDLSFLDQDSQENKDDKDKK
jgi:hypothetical protein